MDKLNNECDDSDRIGIIVDQLEKELDEFNEAIDAVSKGDKSIRRVEHEMSIGSIRNQLLDFVRTIDDVGINEQRICIPLVPRIQYYCEALELLLASELGDVDWFNDLSRWVRLNEKVGKQIKVGLEEIRDIVR